MKLTALLLCCVACALLVSACTQTAPTNAPAPKAAPSNTSASTPTPDPLATARAIYAKDCESCHGEKGEGGLVKVEEKRLKVPSFKAERSLKHTDEQFLKQITNGGDGMPAFKDKLKQEEMEALVKFVKKEFQGR